MASYSEIASGWCASLAYEDIPPDVMGITKHLILNSIAVGMAAAMTGKYGAIVKSASAGQEGPCHVIGTTTKTTPTAAALANGLLISALGYDDSLPETLVHVAGSVFSCALAIAETRKITGREFLVSVAAGNELVCRIGLVAPLQFHKSGLHPSGIIGAMGCAYVAARLLGLSEPEMRNAVGIVGNMAAGINQSWVDGSHAQFVDSGWAAVSAMTAAILARSGLDGPPEVLEGRFGLFRSHIQDADTPLDFNRMIDRLGQHWDCLGIEIKSYPTGHVSLPFVEAMLQLRHTENLRADQVHKITALMAAWMIPVVGEPLEEKRRPSSDLHGKVSIPYTLAETLVHGRLGAGSYSDRDLQNEEILALADRTECLVDSEAPPSDVYKGWVRVELKDGRVLERIVLHGKGKQVLSAAQFRSKFSECLAFAGQSHVENKIWEAVGNLEHESSVSDLADLLGSTH